MTQATCPMGRIHDDVVTPQRELFLLHAYVPLDEIAITYVKIERAPYGAHLLSWSEIIIVKMLYDEIL